MSAVLQAQMNFVATQLQKFEDAVRADEWKGGGDPDDIPNIEATLAMSKCMLLDLIESYIKND